MRPGNVIARRGTYLDNNFWQISANLAGRLCKPVGGLPRPGYEKLVVVDGHKYWITRTVHQRRQVWAAHYAGVACGRC